MLACPGGVPLLRCFVDPCERASCPAYPKARCRTNYCGRCAAEFYGEDNVKVLNCTKGKCFLYSLRYLHYYMHPFADIPYNPTPLWCRLRVSVVFRVRVWGWFNISFRGRVAKVCTTLNFTPFLCYIFKHELKDTLYLLFHWNYHIGTRFKV